MHVKPDSYRKHGLVGYHQLQVGDAKARSWACRGRSRMQVLEALDRHAEFLGKELGILAARVKQGSLSNPTSSRLNGSSHADLPADLAPVSAPKLLSGQLQRKFDHKAEVEPVL